MIEGWILKKVKGKQEWMRKRKEIGAKSFQACPTLCDPLNCSLPRSSVHGDSQARILEWVAMPSSRGSS